MEESASRQAPCGLQDILHRLAVVALSNKPVCFYECFADALERDVIRRTLLEVQAEQYKSSAMSDMAVTHGDSYVLDSPRNCFYCGQTVSPTAPVDSTDPSASDTDYDRPDEAPSGAVEHAVGSRIAMSDPSLVSSRSSTPLDGYVPPPPAPLTGSEDECASLLSLDAASSDDLDSEYVSAMEVPESPQPVEDRDSADTFNDLDDADVVFGSAGEMAADEFDAISSLDDDDDAEQEDAVPLNSTLMGSGTLEESSNSASTLLDDRDEEPRSSRDHGGQSSSGDDSEDEDYGEEMTLLAEASDDADDEDDCLTLDNNPTEPLLAPAGDSDLSDAN